MVIPTIKSRYDSANELIWRMSKIIESIEKSMNSTIDIILHYAK